ncbi:MAG: adenylate/guanylate cyclase domain-containing protein [Thioalkalispiraceae bacterium]|jgi:adenylate cyclase
MKSADRYLAYSYYVITCLFLTILGIRAFTSGAPKPIEVIILGFFFPFLIISIFRWRFEDAVMHKVHYFDQPRRQLIFDFSLFVIAALMLVYHLLITLEQNLFTTTKVVFGTLMMGYFASIDSALGRELHLIQQVRPVIKQRFEVKSFAARMRLLMTITIVITLVAVLFSAIDALDLFMVHHHLSHEQDKQFFLLEVFFIFAIVVSFSIRLIHSYTRNIKLLFDSQLDVLKNIHARNYSAYVPVISNDEFGLVSQEINSVIDELNEKEHIRKTLEQIVSPNIMEKLLKDDKGQLKAGQEYNVGILFCDLRKFTTYAESAPPEEVIFFLNAFFSKVADIVEQNHGIINKFMGDAILAVFGTEEEQNPVEDAVRTAWEILSHSRSNKIRSGKTIDIGIGIHTGTALAGIIGSNNRYEYTFIGDVVNTASRLDGLTKRLGYKVIISQDAYNQLGHDERERFTDLGRHQIRGKTDPVHVYGAIEAQEIVDT